MIESNHSSSTQTNSKTHDTILPESYAPSLRVIGQALETLRINAFKLEKSGDKYIVRDWEPGFLKNIAHEVSGLGNSGQTPFTNKQSGDPSVYDSSDSERLEARGRAMRGSKEIQGRYKISSGLRVVGDYLDKKGAVAFVLWWSFESVTVRYETAAGGPKETKFHGANLQDLGGGMHAAEI